MLGIAFISVWAFRKTPSNKDDLAIFFHRFFVGAVAAWSTIYALITWF